MTCSMAARVIRAIGASENSPSVTAGRISWMKAAQNVSKSPAISASTVNRPVTGSGDRNTMFSLPSGAGARPSR